MFNKIIDWLMGKATEGQRKMVYGTLALILVWIFLMWGPGAATERIAGLETLKWVVGVVIVGNVGEHFAKLKAGN